MQQGNHSTAVASTVREVVERADDLAASGRIHEAIAYATHENRRLREPWLESRLVRWRMDACGSAAEPAAQPPRRIGDVPPRAVGADGVPEVAGSALDADALAAGLRHHGCLLVRGLVTPADAARLARGIDCVFDAIKTHAGRRALPETRAWYAPVHLDSDEDKRLQALRLKGQRAGGLLAIDSPRMIFEMADLFENTGLRAVLEDYFGERPTLSAQKAVLRRVPPTAGTEWHQDGAFLGAETRAVNVWLALTECGIDAPGLDVLPQRLDTVVETGTGEAKFNWSVGPRTVAAVAADTPIVSPVFQPGDALLFDHLLLHRTGVHAGMTKTRWAIESWFFAPSAAPKLYYPIYV